MNAVNDLIRKYSEQKNIPLFSIQYDFYWKYKNVFDLADAKLLRRIKSNPKIHNSNLENIDIVWDTDCDKFMVCNFTYSSKNGNQLLNAEFITGILYYYSGIV